MKFFLNVNFTFRQDFPIYMYIATRYTYLYGRTQRGNCSSCQIFCNIESSCEARSSCRRSSPHFTITASNLQDAKCPYGLEALIRRCFCSHGSLRTAADGSSGSWLKVALGVAAISLNLLFISPGTKIGSLLSDDSWLNCDMVSRSFGLRSCKYWRKDEKLEIRNTNIRLRE